MRFACWITKAIDTHSEYVILIAFAQQQWLRKGASVLRYTYIVYLVENYGVLHEVHLMTFSDIASNDLTNMNNKFKETKRSGRGLF